MGKKRKFLVTLMLLLLATVPVLASHLDFVPAQTSIISEEAGDYSDPDLSSEYEDLSDTELLELWIIFSRAQKIVPV